MKCTTCGYECKVGNKFCNKCGQSLKVPISNESSVVPFVRCPICRTANTPHSRKCAKCGSTMISRQKQKPDSVRKGNFNLVSFIGAVLMILSFFLPLYGDGVHGFSMIDLFKTFLLGGGFLYAYGSTGSIIIFFVILILILLTVLMALNSGIVGSKSQSIISGCMLIIINGGIFYLVSRISYSGMIQPGIGSTCLYLASIMLLIGGAIGFINK